jgi:hypothetical protein
MAKGVVLFLCMVFIATLAFLTVRVAITSGPTIVVALAVVVLLVLGFGIFGALTGRNS